MLLTTNYFNYFRQLAVRHKNLLHDETGSRGGKRFARISYEEFLTGLRSKVTFPALFAEQFEIVMKGENESPFQNYTGAITVLDTANVESMSEIEKASDKTLSILSDILRKLYTDHNGDDSICSSIFEDIDFDGMNIVPVGPVLDQQYGWRCQFNFKMRKGLELTKAPDPGTFI